MCYKWSEEYNIKINMTLSNVLWEKVGLKLKENYEE